MERKRDGPDDFSRPRVGKTLLRRLEGIVGIACNLDPDFLEHHKVFEIYDSLRLDKVSSLEDLSKLGFVTNCIDIVSHFQTQFVKTSDEDADQEYLAELRELEVTLRQLEGSLISILNFNPNFLTQTM